MKPGQHARAIATRAWVAAAVVLMLSLPFGVNAQDMGTLRVKNPYPIPVQIYAPEGYDPITGEPQWRPLAVIPANSYLDFPGVPAGTEIEAHNQAEGVRWRPMKVVYTGRPFAVITLPQPTRD